MVVRIRLFAQLRERAGAEYIDTELADGATVADALRELAGAPAARTSCSTRLPVRMAVNRELAEPDDARCARTTSSRCCRRSAAARRRTCSVSERADRRRRA